VRCAEAAVGCAARSGARGIREEGLEVELLKPFEEEGVVAEVSALCEE
jgi:hypothetical protein